MQNIWNYMEKGNKRRMTGKHETSSFDKFTWGEGNRSASVRIGNDTIKNKKDISKIAVLDQISIHILFVPKILDTCMI